MAGNLVGALIIPRLSDIYGRKWVIIIASLLMSCTFIVTILSKSLGLVIAMDFMMGFLSMNEMLMLLVNIEYASSDLFIIIVTIREVTCSLYDFTSVLYYWAISKSIAPLFIFAIVVTTLTTIPVFFCSESPKLLHAQGKYE